MLSPKEEAHDNMLDNNPDQIRILKKLNNYWGSSYMDFVQHH